MRWNTTKFEKIAKKFIPLTATAFPGTSGELQDKLLKMNANVFFFHSKTNHSI